MDLSRRLDIKHIDKFDGTNYQQWKHGLLMELELIELLDIVEVFNILILGIMANAGHTNM
jgi:hypothetical protein